MSAINRDDGDRINIFSSTMLQVISQDDSDAFIHMKASYFNVTSSLS
jgi:hypothetical protein